MTCSEGLVGVRDAAPRRPHVLLVIDRYSMFGGAEGSTSLVVRELSPERVRFTLFVLEEPDPADVAELASLGVRIVFGGSGGPLTWHQLRRLIKQERPDFLHSVLMRSDVVARVAGMWTGTPVVSSIVNMAFDEAAVRAAGSKAKVRLLQLRTMALERCWTLSYHAVSESAAMSAVRHLRVDPLKVTVVWRGRDRRRLGEPSPSRRREVRDRLGVSCDEQVMLSVGRQDPQKAQRYLIDALARVSGGRPLLLLAGRPGPETPSIVAGIAEHDLGDRVRLLSMRDDIPDLLCAADIFVFTSLWEGLGGAVLEAMALEVPIVAFDIPPVREATGGHAVLVPIGDTAGLVVGIESVLSDPATARSMTSAARARFDELFSLERYIDGMYRFYLDTLTEVGARRASHRRRHT